MRYSKIILLTVFFLISSALSVSSNNKYLIEKFFNEFETLTSNFKQIDSNGKTYHGSILIKKPNFLKILYTSPNNKLILLNNSKIIHHDYDLDETAHDKLDFGLMKLFSEKINFEKDFSIINQSQTEIVLECKKCLQRDDKYSFLLLFNIQNDKLTLKEIKELNELSEVRFIFDKSTYNKKIDEKEFIFKNPKKQKLGGL